MPSQRPLPTDHCTRCGKRNFNLSLSNQRCTERPISLGKPKGERCKGFFRSAVAPGDWTECSTCGGQGRSSEEEAVLMRAMVRDGPTLASDASRLYSGLGYRSFASAPGSNFRDAARLPYRPNPLPERPQMTP